MLLPKANQLSPWSANPKTTIAGSTVRHIRAVNRSQTECYILHYCVVRLFRYSAIISP